MMKLYLRPSNCKKTELIKSLMTDDLWPLVEIQYIASTAPFLEVSKDQAIFEPTEIIAYLDSKSPVFPSVKEQLRNAKEAAKKAYKNVVTNRKLLAPDDLIEHRRKICSACPFSVKSSLIQRCSKCGCGIKAKTTLLVESCPIKNW